MLSGVVALLLWLVHRLAAMVFCIVHRIAAVLLWLVHRLAAMVFCIVHRLAAVVFFSEAVAKCGCRLS